MESLVFWRALSILSLRLLQGISAGGVVFAIEHANPKYTGFVGASLGAGYGLGTVLAALAGFIYSLPRMSDWTWRIFFIFGFWAIFVVIWGIVAFIAMNKLRNSESKFFQ